MTHHDTFNYHIKFSFEQSGVRTDPGPRLAGKGHTLLLLTVPPRPVVLV